MTGFVIKSAHMPGDGQCHENSTSQNRLKICLSHLAHTSWVRCICRIVLFFPDLMTVIAVSLSSLEIIRTFRPRTVSQKSKAGRPTILSAALAATNSASGVEYATQPCFLEIACIGKKLFGPLSTKKMPEVDLRLSLSEARSASEYSFNQSWSGVFPM